MHKLSLLPLDQHCPAEIHRMLGRINCFYTSVWNNERCLLQVITPIEEVLSVRRREEQNRRWLEELDKQREETTERRRREKQLQSQVPSDPVVEHVGSKAVFDESLNVSSAGGPRTLGLALRLPAEKASRLSRSSHSCPITRLWAAWLGAHIKAVSPFGGHEHVRRGECQRRRCGYNLWALRQNQVQGILKRGKWNKNPNFPSQ